MRSTYYEPRVVDTDTASDIIDRFLTPDEQQALRLARLAVRTPMEQVELRYFLGFPDRMPDSPVDSVWRLIVLRLAARGI